MIETIFLITFGVIIIGLSIGLLVITFKKDFGN